MRLNRVSRIQNKPQTLLRAAVFVILFPTRSWCAADTAQISTITQIISDSADRICDKVSDTGHYEETILSADAKVELNNMLSKIANLDGELSAKRKTGDYAGELQADLAKTIKDHQDCKLHVFDRLLDKLLPSTG